MWLRHPVYAYEADENGQIRRCGSLMPRKMRIDRDGYRRMNLWHDKRLITVKACVLVAEAWYGPRPFDGAEVCHGPSGNGDDRPTNLSWGDHQKNLLDRQRDGTTRKGTRALTFADVCEIRSMSEQGATQLALSAKFGTSPSNVRFILARKTWNTQAAA